MSNSRDRWIISNSSQSRGAAYYTLIHAYLPGLRLDVKGAALDVFIEIWRRKTAGRPVQTVTLHQLFGFEPLPEDLVGESWLAEPTYD
jgi:hypothetical protein